MPTPENYSIDLQMSEQPQAPAATAAIAPVWHTIVLVAGILALSFHGAARFSAMHGSINRLGTYGSTAALEVGMLAWVLFGLHLNKTPLRSLLGSFSWDFRSIAADLGFALIFWISSLMVLGTLGIAWVSVEAVFEHRAPVTYATRQTGQELAIDPSQQQSIRALAQVAPANGKEIAAWTLLCLLVGFIEETVFRGYLQCQFISWARGAVGPGILASALVFGGAHGYQGARSMVLLAVFGALFSLLAGYRHSLRAGMFAHGWHDLIVGLTLALLRSSHVI